MEPLYKDKLNPLFWKGLEFNEKIRNKLVRIVLDFIEEVKLDSGIKDITLTGSLANYNYNKYSDLDVHIILDFKKINDDEQLVRDALDGKRFIWNLRHNIFLRGHEVELYFQDNNDPHHATAIYSLLRNKWLKEPTYNPPGDVDVDGINKKAYFINDTVKRMIKALETTKDKKEVEVINKKAKFLKDKIIKIRKEALAERGEFAFENLLFKKLRNENVIEQIISIINMSYDKMFMESRYLTVIRDFIKHELL